MLVRSICPGSVQSHPCLLWSRTPENGNNLPCIPQHTVAVSQIVLCLHLGTICVSTLHGYLQHYTVYIYKYKLYDLDRKSELFLS